MSVYSEIGADWTTMLPQAVTQALGLAPGDDLNWEISDALVTLTRAQPLDLPFLRALQLTLREWSTPEDAAAFDAL